MRNHTLRLILYLVLLGAGASRADDYQLTQGIRVGDFRFSGYTNLVLEAPHTRRNSLDLDDTGIFIAGHVNRWINPFVEAELTRMTLAHEGQGSVNHGQFIRERIYNESNLSDTDALQVGKILAPVGDWNLIHAAPLVPTETRPLTTFQGFSEYSSGVSWLHDGVGGAGPDWQLYAQPGSEWLPRPANIARRQYRDVWGTHLNWPSGASDQIGLSFQRSQLINTDELSVLLGANVRRSFGRLSLESEMIVAHWSGGNAVRAHDTEAGIYALADYAVTAQWHAIVEGEYYQDHLQAAASKNTLIGVAYKPRSGVVWKLEFVDQTGLSRSIPTGWQTSIAVLF
jgi:hypothetical protein